MNGHNDRPRRAEQDPVRLVHLLAEHAGIDLDVLIVADDPRCDWATQELERDIEAVEDAWDAGEELPPAHDARSRTIRRIVANRKASDPFA